MITTLYKHFLLIILQITNQILDKLQLTAFHVEIKCRLIIK
jgi:hypothetical protein